jgi:hypothetical protein
MSQLTEWAGDFDLAVTIANGGYVVYAISRDPDGVSAFRTCVFTDIDVALGYCRRIILEREGPPPEEFLDEYLLKRRGDEGPGCRA